MNKLIRLSPTGIEYGDYAWNFASGCGNNVDGRCNSGGFRCWAYPITQRFADRYPNSFNPTIYPEALLSPLYLKKPSRILCAFMGDLFWDCPESDSVRGRGEFGEDEHGYFTLKGRLFDTIEKCPQHTFLFLTKQPQNLIKWSPFPDNCWVGVSATGLEKGGYLEPLVGIEAKVKYLSCEPLLKSITEDVETLTRSIKTIGIKWVIIGAMTCGGADLVKLSYQYPELTPIPYGNRYTLQPKIEWVQEIVQACDKAGIPVFLKKNIVAAIPAGTPDGLFYKGIHLRQEMPSA